MFVALITTLLLTKCFGVENHGTPLYGYQGTSCPIPTHWTCDPNSYNSGDKCDCNCGIYDPDCDIKSLFVNGCLAGQYCGYDATCQICNNNIQQRGKYLPLVGPSYGICSVQCVNQLTGNLCNLSVTPTPEWTCDLSKYNDGDTCDCQCGSYDPDCDLAGVSIQGCSVGQFCNDLGSCQVALNSVNDTNGFYVSKNGFGITTGVVAVNCTSYRWGPSCTDSCHFDMCQIVSYDQMTECIRSLEVDDEILLGTIDALLQYVELYTFVDKVKEPPFSIDLRKSLSDIRDQVSNLSSDQVQGKLARLFLDLKDAHTVYQKPVSYRYFYFIQPFSIKSFVKEDGNQGIFVDKALDLFSNLEGYEIKTINGQNAIDFMTNFADKVVATSKDLGTRFNLAVDTYWQQQNQMIFNIPENSTNSYLFLTESGNQIEIEVPYFALSLKQINSKDMLMGQYLKPSQNKNSRKRREEIQIDDFNPSKETKIHSLKLKVDSENLISPKNQRQLAMFLKKTQKKITEEPNVSQIFDGVDIDLFAVGNDTAVLKIPTFNPKIVDQFQRDIVWCLMIAQDRNLSNLIIDLRDNGGGKICLGYATAQYLYNNFSFNGAYDFKRSDLYDVLAVIAARSFFTEYSPFYWIDYVTGIRYQDESWLIPGISRTRGGITSNYSQLVYANCSYDNAFMRNLNPPYHFPLWPKPRHENYSPSSILLLSHGYCGSTCAAFARGLSEFHKVRTLVVGGIKGRSQGISSFPGGQVYNQQYIIDDALELNSPIIPLDFPTTARFSWNIRELYSWTPQYSQIPLEFVFEASDFRMDYSETNVRNDSFLYWEILSFFTKCSGPKDTKPCEFDTGYGVYVCDVMTGNYITDKCYPQSCNPGYFYNNISQECTPCHLGTYKIDSGLGKCEICPYPQQNEIFASKEGSTSYNYACLYACAMGYARNDQNKCVKEVEKVYLILGIVAGFGFGVAVAFVIGRVITRSKGNIKWSFGRKYSQVHANELNELETE